MYNARLMVTCSGSLATINCELRQVRKEATVTVISGAEEWLGRVATLLLTAFSATSPHYNQQISLKIKALLQLALRGYKNKSFVQNYVENI